MVTALEAKAKLAPWIAKVQRRAFKPITADGRGAPDGSRFNGEPFVSKGEEWPSCSICRKAMPLFLQLDLDDLPGELAGRFGTGLMQLLYCIDCDVETDAWEPFRHDSKLVRVIPKGPEGTVAHARPHGFSAIPKTIVSWTGFDECPDYAEAEPEGLSIEWRGSGSSIRLQAPELGIDSGWVEGPGQEEEVGDLIFNTAPGDKLGGWPKWIQGVEYPSCPICNAQMRLVFQIDSNDHIPHMFGDAGCGHITQCATHKDVVTFGWACS
jgi:hypothetical protein